MRIFWPVFGAILAAAGILGVLAFVAWGIYTVESVWPG